MQSISPSQLQDDHRLLLAHADSSCPPVLLSFQYWMCSTREEVEEAQETLKPPQPEFGPGLYYTITRQPETGPCFDMVIF